MGFEGLASDVMSSDLMKGFVDIGTWIINAADAVVRLNDKLGTTAATVGSIIAVIKSIKSIS